MSPPHLRYARVMREIFGERPPDADDEVGRNAVARRWITPEQWEECIRDLALRRERDPNLRAASILLDRGYLTPRQYARLLGTAPVETDAPTRALGKYRLVREIGRGGMGIVWEAWDPDLRRCVALKTLRADETDGEAITRFRREAEIAAQLHHPNIVAVHEVGTASGADGQKVHYISMDLVPGRTLADLLAAEKKDRKTLLRLLIQVAEAMGHAHEKGIVHRDLKPGNVLLDAEGRVFVTDFGLAQARTFQSAITRAGTVMGTPAYMAPEQVESGNRTDARTDVHALGVILYEILAGRLPFQGPTAAKTYARVLESDATPPQRYDRTIPRDLEIICLKALEKDPSRRYPTANEFAQDLNRALAGEPISARPPSVGRRIGRALRKRRGAAALALGGTAVGVVLALLLPRWLEERGRARQEAAARAEETRAARERETTLRELHGLWIEVVRAQDLVYQRHRKPEEVRRARERAVQGLSDYIARNPRDHLGWYLRARARLDDGDPARAKEDALAALKRDAGFAPGWRLLARICLEKHGFDYYHRPGRKSDRELTAAREALRRAARLDTAREDPWSQEGEETMLAVLQEHFLERGHDRAVRILQEAQARRPSEWNCRWLGLTAKTTEEEEKWFGRAIEIAPLLPWSYLGRGLARRRSGDYAGADADLAAALKLRPRFAPLYFVRAQLWSSKKRPEKAIRDYTKAIEIHPDYAEALSNRGAVWKSMGKIAEAIADFDRALEIDPDLVEPRVNRGNVRLEKGDFAGARRDYDHAIRVDPRSAASFNQRGRMWVIMKKDRLAELDFAQAIKLDRHHAYAYYNRGLLKRRRGDLPGAIADFTSALKHSKHYPDVTRAYGSRAYARAKMKDFAGALADAKLLVARRGRSAGTLHVRADIRQQAGDFAGALEDAAAAIKLDPKFASAYALRGSILARQGDLKSAEADLRTALRIAPKEWAHRRNTERVLREVEEDLRKASPGGFP